ncbi:MAG: PucR family transcriptional regulator [Candidatus Limnocylindrales bacterium]
MPTLEEVRDAVFPAADPLVPPALEAGRLPVAWVRLLKARSPAFDVLEPGDLAIAPERALATLAAGPVEPSALVDGIVRAGAAGVLLVGEGTSGPMVARAVARLRELGLPTYRLAGGDATQLERAVIGFLVNARAEVERQAARLEGQLEELALAGAGAGEFAAAVATFLGRAVALEDPHGRVLAVHAPALSPTAARDAARYVARPASAVALRLALADVGALVLLGPASPTELERTAAARVAPLLAIALGQGAGLPGAPRARREAGLPAAGPPWVVLMARQIEPGLEAPRSEREALRARLRRLAPARRLALRGDADSLELRLVVSAGADDPQGLEIGERVAVLAGRTVAASRPFVVTEGRPLAEQEARATLEAAEALGRGAAAQAHRALRVARADRLAVYRLLGGLADLPGGRREAAALLAPLQRGSPAARAERLATLRALLDQAGPGAAASALGIHRNTLAYRVRRIEAQTGWRLDDPDLRFTLALALRLVQSDQP